MFEKSVSQRISMIAKNIGHSTLIQGQLSSSQLRALCLALRKNTELTTLFLEGGAFSADQWSMVFDAMHCHPNLQFLEICQYDELVLPPSFRKFVENSPSLREITVSRTALSDTDIRLFFEVIKGKNIKALRLFGPIGCSDVILDSVIDFLPDCVLTRLNLPIYRLDIEQSRRLSEALLLNNTLVYLDFSDVDTVIQPGALQPLLQMLSRKPNISWLTLGLVEGEEDYYRLANFLSSNTSVTHLSISNELDPKMLNYMIDKIIGNNETLCGFIYQCHFQALTERELDRFYDYMGRLDDIIRGNKWRMESQQSEAPEQKKRKV